MVEIFSCQKVLAEGQGLAWEDGRPEEDKRREEVRRHEKEILRYKSDICSDICIHVVLI